VAIGKGINSPVKLDAFLNVYGKSILISAFYKITDHIAGKNIGLLKR
jgi:hypothetical protein